MNASVIETVSGAGSRAEVAAALGERAELMRASQASYEAIMNPRQPGGLAWARRLALACRMARLNGEGDLARHYREALSRMEDAGAAALADPAAPAPRDARLAAILRHVDLVTRAPREATRQDIEALKAAGMAEADIVRLAQLIAFVNYQARVIAGLKLLEAAR